MTSPQHERPIVVIEDSDEDYEVLEWALRQAGFRNPLHRCANAADLALLTVRRDWPPLLKATFPLLILMDLNLPGTEWRETLAELRGHLWWQTVPLMVISTSVQPASVATCYGMGAAGYLRKPLDLDACRETMRTVAAYWLRTVVAPEPPDQEAP